MDFLIESETCDTSMAMRTNACLKWARIDCSRVAALSKRVSRTSNASSVQIKRSTSMCAIAVEASGVGRTRWLLCIIIVVAWHFEQANNRAPRCVCLRARPSFTMFWEMENIRFREDSIPFSILINCSCQFRSKAARSSFVVWEIYGKNLTRHHCSSPESRMHLAELFS